ncbi:alpha/beta fold hydrolase [Saccharothrix sp. NRRL B-16314]|uniref:alpha/beta fold hydrolase n=1 Tax=Saccharothrix sp. NRRL B-16314 TaxID=1463825 RepID=UPI00055F40A4|nr:alpha/beta hydrolase [Saccharothrix sp. NRRL B-16314]
MREHDVFSADGTRIRLWRTEADGPDVLLSPGLGAVPTLWPELPAARVHSWYHRGTMASDRPADPGRIGVDDHVADALAVLDDGGVERCVVMGWSMGVTVAAALALRHPERVSGLMLVAGAPGDTFASVLGLPGLPVELRRLIGVSGATALKAAGPLLDAVLHRLPVPDLSRFTGLAGLGDLAGLARPTGLGGLFGLGSGLGSGLGGSLAASLTGSLRRYLQHDWRWYFTLALALGRSPRLDLTGVTCPTTVLAGRYDLLASTDGVVGPVAGLPQARVRMLPNTHFLPLEDPQVVVDELDLLLDRADAVHRAVHEPDGPLTSRSRPRA